MKTGDTCSMEMVKETCPIMGTWKPVSISGATSELYAMAGVPADFAEKLANDFESRMVIDEKGPMVHWQNKSKLMPIDCSFKFGQETSIHDPVLNETTKVVCTKSGNCLQMVQMSSSGTWISDCTVGNTFMVMKTYLQGLPCQSSTVVFTREC